MDPATLTLIGAIIQLFQQYGPGALILVGIWFAGRGILLVIRAWQNGDFLPKTYVDRLQSAKDELIKEITERYKASQAAVQAWRTNSEKALNAAEAAQGRQKQIMEQMAEIRDLLETMRKEIHDLREEVYSARSWGELGRANPNPPRIPGGRRQSDRDREGI